MSGNVTPIEGDGNRRVAPCDLDAERAVLGAMLLATEARRVASRLVLASDFFRPQHGELFNTIMELHASGEVHGHVDVRTVADVLRRRRQLDAVGGEGVLSSIINSTPATSNVARYCRIVTDMAALRRVISICGDAIADARALPQNVGDFLDGLVTSVRSVEIPSTAHSNVHTVDAFYDAGNDVCDWVIPLYLERGERVIFVAAEGVGKSVVTRQVAIAAAQGIHPFSPTDRMPPIRTLLVDFENPERIIRKTMDRLLAQAIRDAGPAYDQNRMHIWHDPAGIDIRSRNHFATFDAVCAETKPDLVCIGPLYKLFRKQRNESDEDAALDVTARLDDLRTRHGFALVIEHHAPKGTGGHREMMPFGSAVWLRWPEFGPALSPHPKAKPGQRGWLVWSHWRGPRDMRPWPTEMYWGSGWPWEFTLPDGVKGHSKESEDDGGMF